jgi:hypothetical protein
MRTIEADSKIDGEWRAGAPGGASAEPGRIGAVRGLGVAKLRSAVRPGSRLGSEGDRLARELLELADQVAFLAVPIAVEVAISVRDDTRGPRGLQARDLGSDLPPVAQYGGLKADDARQIKELETKTPGSSGPGWRCIQRLGIQIPQPNQPSSQVNLITCGGPLDHASGPSSAVDWIPAVHEASE